MNCVRVESKNGEYHIILTFIKELKVFSDKADRKKFTNTMIDVMDKMECKIYMQTIMLNHAHLIVKEGKEKKISSIVISLCTRFAKYYNKKNNRKGRLFSKRYFSIPINDEIYMFRLFRYISRNAVKINLVKEPWDYEWSSARAYKNREGRFFFPEVLARYEKTFRYHPYTLTEFISFEGDDKLEYYTDQIVHNDAIIKPPFSLEDFLNSNIDDNLILSIEFKRYDDDKALEIYNKEMAFLHIKDLETHEDPKAKKKVIFRMRQIGLTLKQIRAFSGMSAFAVRKAMFPTI